MKIPPVKGTRDFYPPDMAIHNIIVDRWRKVSLRNGFEEYDGPIFEYLKMFQIKSGDEIVEQLFSLTDRGGRDLALRPEMTPTLARMVNQRINALPKPIKWFSVPRLFRAERPQKGRLREFFQWNIDIIGEESVLADAEIIFTTVDYLRGVGLTPKDVKVKISSRKLLAAVLKSYGVSNEKLKSLYALFDKKAKLHSEAFKQMLAELVPDKEILSRISKFMEIDSLAELRELIDPESEAFTAYREIRKVIHTLEIMGVGNFCVYDPGIVRGLAYYTGIVFEVHDVVGDLRAICGGGRYDNLLHDLGGPTIPATGMGMGDCVLEILLKEKGVLDKLGPQRHLECFVVGACDVDEEMEEEVEERIYRITAKLRSMDHPTSFSYKMGSLSKQLKEASASKARECIIIGEQELREKKITVKDMATGKQKLMTFDEFLLDLRNRRPVPKQGMFFDL